MSQRQILIVEDEPQIRRFVTQALKNEGWQVIESGTGAAGLILAGDQALAMIILDLGLPDMDGQEFIRAYRSWSQTPLLILSARDGEEDKILALDNGADDYLSKPFGVGELLARVRALSRRRPASAEAAPTLGFADITVDFSRRIVTRNDEELHLTPIEYRLLCALLTNPGKVLTHRHLLREVWGQGYAESSHYLRVYVGRLRQKLEADPTRPRHFLTETGVGYRFQP